MAQHCVQHLQTDEIDFSEENYYGLNIKYIVIWMIEIEDVGI